MLRRLSLTAAAVLLSALPLASAVAADLTGKWTTDGRYVFTFTRAGNAWTGSVREAATGREFKLADIVDRRRARLVLRRSRCGVG